MECETEGSRFRPQLQLNFRDARGVVRTYVIDASHPAESIDHGVCNPGKALRVRMRQHGLHRVAQVEDLAAEGDAAYVGQHPHLLPPCLHDLSGGDFSLLGAQEFELNGGDVGLRIEGRLRIEPALESRALSDGHRYAGQQRWRIPGPAARESFDDPVACGLQFLRHFVRPRSGRPIGHLQDDRRDIPLHVSGQRGRNDPRGQQGDAQHEHSHSPRHRHRGLVGGELQGPIQRALDEPVQQRVNAPLEPREEPVEGIGRHPLRAVQVGQVVGQHQQRFD